MRLDKLPFEVFNTINKYHLVKPHDSIIVAVSGGPDSVALLKILRTINLVKNLHLRLFIAHLNHQLRGSSSEEDAQFVRNLSKDLSLPFILKKVNIQKIADQTKCSIEETARRERYNFFSGISAGIYRLYHCYRAYRRRQHRNLSSSYNPGRRNSGTGRNTCKTAFSHRFHDTAYPPPPLLLEKGNH